MNDRMAGVGPRAWERIQPGYYRLRGTDVFIANMKGQSVKWSGLQPTPWEVRTEPSLKNYRAGMRIRTRGQYESLVLAKMAAIQWAREEGWL